MKHNMLHICKILIHFNRWRCKFNHLPAVSTYLHLQHFKKFEEDAFQETLVITDLRKKIKRWELILSKMENYDKVVDVLDQITRRNCTVHSPPSLPPFTIVCSQGEKSRLPVMLNTFKCHLYCISSQVKRLFHAVFTFATSTGNYWSAESNA